MHLARIEFRGLRLDQWLGRHRGIDRADHRAVPRRDIGDVVHGDERAGARHILDDNLRIPGKVLAHMVCDHAGVSVIAAARRGANDDADGLVLEIGVLCLRGLQRRQEDAGEHCRSRHRRSHCFTLPLTFFASSCCCYGTRTRPPFIATAWPVI